MLNLFQTTSHRDRNLYATSIFVFCFAQLIYVERYRISICCLGNNRVVNITELL